MRTIRIIGHVSLDGVNTPTGDDDFANYGWQAPYRTPAGAAALAEAQGTHFDLLLGRRTYDGFAGIWSKQKGGPFADGLNAATKYVATHRPESLGWGPVGNLGTDVMAGIRQLKSTDGPDLVVWGSLSLTAELFEQGLVDAIVLVVHPVLLGQGRRYFPDSVDMRELALVRTIATATGVLLNTYRHVGLLRKELTAASSSSSS